MSEHGWLGLGLAELAREVSQADPIKVGASIAVCAAAAAFAGWYAWRSIHKARTIEDIPTSKTRSAHQGYVELEGAGRLMDGAPIVGPLSGLPCVWYRYRVEERVTVQYKGGTQHRWRTVDSGESTETFWLEDDTGRAVVDPEGADITPRHKDLWHSGMLGLSSPLHSDFVASYIARNPTGNPHRFTEWRINPGDPIYALGSLRNLGSHINSTTVDEDARELLREWKQDQARLRERFDLNQDGKIDEKEWMLARAQARREALNARREQQNQFTDGLNLLGPTNDSSRPFILSAFPQDHIVRRYRWQAALYGAGFFVLGTIAVWLFNTKFG